jgi:hypothetical protein
MECAVSSDRIDEAFGRIEDVILPNVSMMLEALLDAAQLASTGSGQAACAAELKAVACQLDALTRQVEAIAPAPPVQAVTEWPIRMRA